MSSLKHVGQMARIKLMVLLIMISSLISAQQKIEKLSKSVKVDGDAVVDLNISYVEIEVATWDKNTVKVEAFVESDKLSKAELQEVVDNWDIDIEGSGEYVKIESRGANRSWAVLGDLELDKEALRELELELADLPELPEMPEMPEMPKMPEIPELNFHMPEMPEIPELPELPEDMHNVNFDYDEYKKDKEKYLENWSKEYEEKYGKNYKKEMRAWAKEFEKVDWKGFEKRMEEWGEKFGEKFGEDFGKKMEAWGEKFGESFGEDYERKMEEWGERFGEKMERKAEMLANRLEEREAQRAERHAALAERMHERQKSMEKRHEALAKRMEKSNNTKVKKSIKITVPKKAKMKMNVRHGELKFSSVIHNLKADISHATLLADNIDGSDTSINVSYSPVIIDNWISGELLLNFVDKAQIKTVDRLVLGSNSSNIKLEHLIGSAIIDGSFGDLTIARIGNEFKNLNIVLENSDAIISLPQTTYNLQYKGNRSKLSHPKSNDDRTTTFSTGDLASTKTIVINSKFSNVIMQ